MVTNEPAVAFRADDQDIEDLLERSLALGEAQHRCVEFNQLAVSIHRLNRHFYRDLVTAAPIARNTGELIALMHSELSEMLEGVRKNLPDSHLPEFPAETVELADLLIRAFDYAAYRKLDLAGAIICKLSYNARRTDHTREARLAPTGKKF